MGPARLGNLRPTYPAISKMAPMIKMNGSNSRITTTMRIRRINPNTVGAL